MGWTIKKENSTNKFVITMIVLAIIGSTIMIIHDTIIEVTKIKYNYQEDLESAKHKIFLY